MPILRGTSMRVYLCGSCKQRGSLHPVVAACVALAAPHGFLGTSRVARGGQTADQAGVVFQVGFLEVEHEVIARCAVAAAVV